MSELMRFRRARAPEKHAANLGMQVSLYDPIVVLTHVPPEHPLDTIVRELLATSTSFMPGFTKGGFTVLDKGAMFSTPVGKIESWLTLVGNRPSVENLETKLTEILKSIDPQSHASGTLTDSAKELIAHANANWWNHRRNAAISLMVAMLKDNEPSRAMYFNRMILVCGLIELAAKNPEALKSPDNIFASLRWRSVVLPRPFVEYLQRGSLWLTSWAQGAK